MKRFMSSLALCLVLGQAALADDVALLYSVTIDPADPVFSELIIEVDNTRADEIWNVDVRLENGYLGLCPDVFQFGRVPAGAARKISVICVAPLDSPISDTLLWRIDFDSDSGHQQLATLGIDDSESTDGGQ